MEELKTTLIDDGSLDTVIKVEGSLGVKVFRFNFDDNDCACSIKDQIISAMKCSEEDYFIA